MSSVVPLAGSLGWACSALANANWGTRLTPLFDRLPEIGRDPTAISSRSGILDQAWDVNLYPLLIGLGPRAARFLARIVSTDRVPADAGLYRPTVTLDDTADRLLSVRLEKTAIATLLIDPVDPAARADAVVWAQRLVEAGVYLPLAVMFDCDGSRQATALRDRLPVSVIELHPNDPALGSCDVLKAMLPGLPFHQRTLVGVDLSDTRAALQAGSRAVATAVRWRGAAGRAQAFEQAWANLPPISPAGVLAWVTASPEYSIGDFDATANLLVERLGLSTTCVYAPFFDPGYAPGERLLSLTVVGA
jgi:hypothetical protein